MNVNEMFSLKGKVAVVTGGAGLYGHAITEALCEAGARVVVASRSDKVFKEKFADQIAQYPLTHEKLDITDAASINAFFDRMITIYNRLDILINNAFTPPLGSDILSTNTEDWDKALSGNMLSSLLMCQGAAKIMTVQKSGTIINISSIWGVVVPDYEVYREMGMQANPIAYSVIKGGVFMMTRALASQLAPSGIRVNSISPGGIADDSDSEGYRAVYRRKTPLGRWANPEDIKGTVVFLASDASSYITGENIIVDGGYTIR